MKCFASEHIFYFTVWLSTQTSQCLLMCQYPDIWSLSYDRYRAGNRYRIEIEIVISTHHKQLITAYNAYVQAGSTTPGKSLPQTPPMDRHTDGQLNARWAGHERIMNAVTLCWYRPECKEMDQACSK